MAFKWTTRSEQAAVMVADDHLSDCRIAAKLGITDRTLRTWKAEGAFQSRVSALVGEFAASALTTGIADKNNRVRRLDQTRRKLLDLIDARAEEMGPDEDIAGGETGLLARDIKSIGSGPFAREVHVFRADTALLAELRATEEQAAKELGQWVDKVAPTNPEGDAEYAGNSDERRIDRLMAIFDAARARRGGEADEVPDADLDAAGGPAE